MTLAPKSDAERTAGKTRVQSLVPRFDHPIHRPMDRETAAWWALDISRARPLIDAIAAGERQISDTRAFVDNVLIADIDHNNVHLLAPYGAGSSMIGQPVPAYWPPESWSVLVELILAAVADFPRGAPRSRRVTSIAFTDAVLNISIDEDGTNPDLVFLSVGGRVADNRSLWSVRASDERYRTLIHHLPFALIQVDSRAMLPIFEGLQRDGITDIVAWLGAHPEMVIESRNVVRITDANRNAVHLFGARDVADLLGSVDHVFAVSPDTAARVIAAHFEGRRSHVEVMKLRRFDGELRDVELSVTYPTPPERLDITLLMFEDVTEKLRTETQLRQLQADFSRAGRIATLGELATSIAHEVSQPLSAIVTNAETSLRWLARDDRNLAKVEQLTQRIAESAHRAHEIVQRIRGMASRHMPETRRLQINEAIEDALLFVRHDVDARSIELAVALEPEIVPVLGDRVQIQQVIVNLLLNSIQALAQREAITGRIEVRTDHGDDGWTIVSVRDDGPGIAAGNLDRVFDGFFTTKEDGIGIGLAICHSIITAHGGRISAANHPEGGALFEIRLPPAPPAP